VLLLVDGIARTGLWLEGGLPQRAGAHQADQPRNVHAARPRKADFEVMLRSVRGVTEASYAESSIAIAFRRAADQQRRAEAIHRVLWLLYGINIQ